MFSSFHRLGSGGDGLKRIRNASIALLGVVTAIGLGLVAFVSQQEWPAVFSGPIPGGPADVGVVHNDAIALRLPGGNPFQAALDGAPAPSSAGRTGGTTAPAGNAGSGQIGVAPAASPGSEVRTPPAAPAAPPVSTPPAPTQPAATPPASTPVAVSAPSPSFAVDDSSKPIASGTSDEEPEEGKDEEVSGSKGSWSDKSKGYSSGKGSSGKSKGYVPEKPKSSEEGQSSPLPSVPAPPEPSSKDDYELPGPGSPGYEKSDKDDY